MLFSLNDSPGCPGAGQQRWQKASHQEARNGSGQRYAQVRYGDVGGGVHPATKVQHDDTDESGKQSGPGSHNAERQNSAPAQDQHEK